MLMCLWVLVVDVERERIADGSVGRRLGGGCVAAGCGADRGG